MKRQTNSAALLFGLGLACGLVLGWVFVPRQVVVAPQPAAPVVVLPPSVASTSTVSHSATPFGDLCSERGTILARSVDRAEYERQHAQDLQDYQENPAALVVLHLARADAMHFIYLDDHSSLSSLELARDHGERLWDRTVLWRMHAANEMGRIMQNEKRLPEAVRQYLYAEQVFEETNGSNPHFPRPLESELSKDNDLHYRNYNHTINGLLDTLPPERAAKQPVYWGGWRSVFGRRTHPDALVIHPWDRPTYDTMRILKSMADEQIDWPPADKAAALRTAELVKERLEFSSNSFKSMEPNANQPTRAEIDKYLIDVFKGHLGLQQPPSESPPKEGAEKEVPKPKDE